MGSAGVSVAALSGDSVGCGRGIWEGWVRSLEYMPGDAALEGFRLRFGRKEVRELEWVEG